MDAQTATALTTDEALTLRHGDWIMVHRSYRKRPTRGMVRRTPSLVGAYVLVDYAVLRAGSTPGNETIGPVDHVAVVGGIADWIERA